MKMFIFTIDNLLWGTMYNVYFWGYLAFYMASYVFLLPFFFISVLPILHAFLRDQISLCILFESLQKSYVIFLYTKKLCFCIHNNSLLGFMADIRSFDCCIMPGNVLL